MTSKVPQKMPDVAGLVEAMEARRNDLRWMSLRHNYHNQTTDEDDTPLYTAPQPAEEIGDSAPYDDPAFESLCREYGIWGTDAAAQCAVFWEAGKRGAEQKPAPDVSALVNALEGIMRVEARDRIMPVGAEWDAARAALAAHRKGGE